MQRLRWGPLVVFSPFHSFFFIFFLARYLALDLDPHLAELISG